MSRICLVTALENDEALKWGLEPGRIAVPLVVFCSPDMAPALRERGVSAHVSIVPMELPHAVAPTNKLVLMADARGRRSAADHYYWVDIELIYRNLSFEFLYSDLLVQAIRHFGLGAKYFLMPGYDASSFFGGPRAVVESVQTRCNSLPLSLFQDAPPASASPALFSAAFGYGSGVDLNLQLAQVIEDPILHVAGDSHVLNCLTLNQAIGCRPNVLVRTRDVCEIGVPYAYQFTHHLGGRTMHHAGQPGALLAAAEQFGLRNGDAVVWVFGEIDVRSHILRQHREAARAVDEVIDTLARNYIRSILEVQRSYPRTRNVVFAPIPPLDNPEYKSVDLPVHGSIDERVSVTRQLRGVLNNLCDRDAILFLDVALHFETPRGDLRCELSDRFCHIASTYQAPILRDLYSLLAGQPRVHVPATA